MKNTFIRQFLLALFMLFGAFVSVSANTNYDYFGSLPQATFGGTGIPNDNVAVSTYLNPNGGVTTLGITAHQRYGNNPLTNDGAGTFFALAGGDVLNGKPNYATWNFAFYGSGIADTNLWGLWYDLDPAANSGYSGFLSFSNVNLQDSWNLGMTFLGGTNFDPTINGEYGFALGLYNQQYQLLEMASIIVNSIEQPSNNVPDTGATISLLALAVGAMATARRKLFDTAPLATAKA